MIQPLLETSLDNLQIQWTSDCPTNSSAPALRIPVFVAEYQALSRPHFSLGVPSYCRTQYGMHRGHKLLQLDPQLLSRCPEPPSACVLVPF